MLAFNFNAPYTMFTMPIVTKYINIVERRKHHWKNINKK